MARRGIVVTRLVEQVEIGIKLKDEPTVAACIELVAAHDVAATLPEADVKGLFMRTTVVGAFVDQVARRIQFHEVNVARAAGDRFGHNGVARYQCTLYHRLVVFGEVGVVGAFELRHEPGISGPA